MRRWPHPIAAQRAAEGWESQLYALRCQLDAQTRLLEEIRALLEQRGTGK